MLQSPIDLKSVSIRSPGRGQSRVVEMPMGAPTMRVLEFVILMCRISVLLLIPVPLNASRQGYNFECPAAIFGLGDSLLDTGELLRAFPSPALALSGNPPYGSSFPGYPTGRYGDGKLMIDFIAEGVGLPLVHPYFANLGAEYKHGVNFAVAGSTSRNTPISVPFFLAFQVDQALFFHSASLARSKRLLLPHSAPGPSSFTRRGLYYITSGGNDIILHLALGGPVARLTIPTIRAVILPEVVSNISAAVTRLYEEIGARQFVVWGISAVGCTPALLTLLQTDPEAGPLDELGCLEGVNNLVQELNSQLAAGIQGLRQSLPDALIILVDFYSITRNITTDYRNYGFKEKLKACCGSPTGPYDYNYDPTALCGMPGANFSVCAEPAKYISWDGVHYTQAAYKLMAEAFLSGQILDPPIPISSLCN